MIPLVLVALLASGPAARAATYYVSLQGDDAHTGLGPEPAQALRTLQAGVDLLQPGDTLLIRSGVYREAVVFPRSGETDAPITLKPYQDEQVLVTGCDPVSGWTRGEGNVWKAPMPWTLGLGRNQVFAEGEVLIEARFPNEPAPGLEMYVSDLSPLWPTFGEFSIPSETKKEQPGRIVSKLLDGQPDNYWKGALYYGVHFEGWCGQTGVIESSKSGEITVGDRTRGWWFGSAYGGGDPSTEEGRGMIVGHMHALDQPGEWVWQDNTLYLIAKQDGEPTNVEAKARQLAFDLSGQEHIRIEGLNIKAASVRMQDSAWCTFERCNLSYISHFTKHYGMGQLEDGRDTIKSGETGIFVGGHDNAFLNCSVRISAGAGFHLRGYHHTIHNCLIDEVSYTSHYLNAITDAVGDFPDYENFLVGGHVVTFNTMCNAGRHFFNFYGNGPNTASRTRSGMDYMATLFAHNHLYNGMLQTRDAGFITGYYCSGGTLDGLNSQVAYNVLHDNYDISAMRWNVLGHVYLDAGTCNVDVHHNLLWAAPGSLQRGLWFNTCCTDCSEHDNVFQPEFVRTCAELTPDDFPASAPFRFGHDFANAPPVPRWPQLDSRLLQAEECSSQSPGVVKTEGSISGLMDGDWFAFDRTDLSEGWQSVVMRFASDVKSLNADKSNRAAPRHTKVTDPLVMEAVTNDGASPGIGQQWTFIRNVKDGAWIRFSQVPLGEGYLRFRAVYGKVTDVPAWIEVRLDAADGPEVARAPLEQTDRVRGGSIQLYRQATAELSPDAQGTRDVFLVFRAEGDQPVGEFEYFRFERYRGQIALAKDEVKLEVRVGSPEGEKIGEFHPRYTGGPDTFRDMVATLEPATGTQPLFFVVRSALLEPIGTIDSLRLERAVDPQDWSGIGVPPRTDADGRMILPAPTNRPRSRPADKYAHAATVIQTPRPIWVAARLPEPPIVDGALGEWTGRATKLYESFDRNLSAAPASEAWVGYDDQALYVAVRNPVTNAGALAQGGHQWGKSDGMEVAFQDAFATQPGPILNLYGYPDGTFESVATAGAPPEVVAKLGAAVTYKAAIGQAEWTCEWRIPFAACGLTPQSASLLRFNLGVLKSAQKAWVVWRGTGAATYRVANAGLLVLPAEAAAVGVPRDGLAVWLDSADADSVETDAAMRVAVWEDKSGRSRDATQPNEAWRPTYVADALNGRPSLRFDESRLTRLELPDLSQERITATTFAVISNPEPGAEVNHDPRIFTASDGKEFDYQIGIALTVPGMETGGPRVLSAVFTDRWAKSVRVGCFSPNYQTYLKGLISEIVVYDRKLTENETDRVRAYLTGKWGLE
jgi:hypothetical protein